MGVIILAYCVIGNCNDIVADIDAVSFKIDFVPFQTKNFTAPRNGNEE